MISNKLMTLKMETNRMLLKQGMGNEVTRVKV